MFFAKIFSFIRKYWRELGYYTAVMLVLGGLAWGAELYRAGRDADTQLPLTVSADTVQMESETPEFTLPQGMLPSGAFSAEPVWNEELLCWQSHTGVDFPCGDVKAIGEGMVTSIGESSIYGGFAEVDAGEYRIRYCSIVPDSKLEIGKNIGMGDIIGTADDSMPAEAYMGAHVHVEAVCGGNMLDVMQLVQTSD